MEENPKAEAVHAVIAFVKRERPRALTKEERLDILMLCAQLKLAGEKYVSVKVAKLLGRSKSVVQSVWAEFTATKGVSVQTAAGNRSNHATRFPRTPAVINLVIEFVRQRQGLGLTTEVTDIMQCLVENRVLQVDHRDSKSVQASLRAISRFLRTINNIKATEGKLSLIN
ncbi:unnamed protein product [Aphanomyces euteiches]|uniref:Uncharacterized protein n=1 Tax=Aphanomyces euteiches TaxID=100861 RepID=A0A6G0XIY4_9STRA|nr:hypothetical protein Ae201684_004252 [Aphanomyces euteiches]KAH9093591.1 hypothetical protein Ae201684P_016218 [Aphanomyces euteiches]KAH9107937.1 hypothetical protein AeMF1_016758 [Aphanomyces euteiches]KAH9117131.1 hypothetical protein LEN26_012785 [Aphanomyces euteiches]KAH9140054.1 hypothetical protein AeRB84_015661 [Aphanomyces euteiches]